MAFDTSRYGAGSFTKEDESFEVELFAHPEPDAWTEAFPVAASTTLLYGQVVGLNAGNLVAAVDGSIKPIGVLAHSIATAVGQTANGTVYRSGHFKKDSLIWDASYNTDTKKLAAFRDVDLLGGTQIVVS